ncbi:MULTISPECIES: PTS sugar transporter subunit IIB [Enterococcus]|uniref:PTS sugar transporter subunit IIB n=1 Tax=Candidatus Enterococcus murrayae TaxID=2815321 RepID=A0ABS3HJV9_9ENTE|nr:PTS sugar transporter subunit IIB [Enterococcus sp. MJM16]MBO0453724.1 PTS sugar transporter subunit IIB [Enterococcus sp. MJM16]
MFFRIDDRLVHGQVVTAWIKQLGAKRIVVIDDLAASNPIISKALTMATPKHVELVIKKVDEAVQCVNDYSENDTLFITKAPVSAKQVIEANNQYDWKLNVGNIGMAPGRKKYAQTVHLDEENYQAIDTLKCKDCVEVFMQTVPGQPVSTF